MSSPTLWDWFHSRIQMKIRYSSWESIPEDYSPIEEMEREERIKRKTLRDFKEEVPNYAELRSKKLKPRRDRSHKTIREPTD